MLNKECHEYLEKMGFEYKCNSEYYETGMNWCHVYKYKIYDHYICIFWDEGYIHCKKVSRFNNTLHQSIKPLENIDIANVTIAILNETLANAGIVEKSETTTNNLLKHANLNDNPIDRGLPKQSLTTGDKTETVEITPENLKEVLLNSGWKRVKHADEVFKFNTDKIQYEIQAIETDGHSSGSYHLSWLTLIETPVLYYNNEISLCEEFFSYFIKCIESIVGKLKPLPIEEDLLTWWGKNKVEGFQLDEYNDDSFCFVPPLQGAYTDWCIKIPNFWTLKKQKETILKLIEIYKD